MNEDILDSKVIIFAGAGASANLGMPTTPQFVEILREKLPNANNILEAYSKYFKSEYPGTKIRTILDSEYIRDWLLQMRRAAESIEMLPNIPREPKIPQPQAAAKYVDNIIFAFDNLVRDSYTDTDPNKAYQHYLPLLETLLSNGFKEIPIFTTNYDLVFESMGDCERCNWVT